jgi:Rrf2 family iron-sulfur cluster assembly transcriptional regulator
MVDLALHSEDGPVARDEITERQDISADYVAQLFQKLQEAGLVEGVKGPGGGYRLALDASEIRARKVIEAVEGPVALVHCVEPGGASSCDRVGHCVTHLLWNRLSAAMREFLDATTLEELAAETRQLCSSFPPPGGRAGPSDPSVRFSSGTTASRH